jgi:hypothetical protein
MFCEPQWLTDIRYICLLVEGGEDNQVIICDFAEIGLQKTIISEHRQVTDEYVRSYCV